MMKMGTRGTSNHRMPPRSAHFERSAMYRWHSIVYRASGLLRWGSSELTRGHSPKSRLFIPSVGLIRVGPVGVAFHLVQYSISDGGAVVRFPSASLCSEP